MRYLALACDYDGTLAEGGQACRATLGALDRLLASGRKLILVTGREIEDLRRVFPHLNLFERVVAENGALLYRPASLEEKVLGHPSPRGVHSRHSPAGHRATLVWPGHRFNLASSRNRGAGGDP